MSAMTEVGFGDVLGMVTEGNGQSREGVVQGCNGFALGFKRW